MITLAVLHNFYSTIHPHSLSVVSPLTTRATYRYNNIPIATLHSHSHLMFVLPLNQTDFLGGCILHCSASNGLSVATMQEIALCTLHFEHLSYKLLSSSQTKMSML